MSKIICDVCGTTYPDTSSVCPICGSARVTSQQTEAGTEMEPLETGRQAYVPGGRFSKANVRKRNEGNEEVRAEESARSQSQDPVPPRRERRPRREEIEQEEEEDTSSKGLIIVVVVLVLAILAVCAYIGIKMFGGRDNGPSVPATEPTVQTTEPTGSAEIPCTDLVLDQLTINLNKIGSEWLLGAAAVPSNTTDEVHFVSSDVSVVTVSAGGKITAIAPGEATITVTCGAVSRSCTVVVAGERPTESTEPTESHVTLPQGFELKLSKTDITMTGVGQTAMIYQTISGVTAKDITWTSQDESICTVVDGQVTAVGPGKTNVVATVGGQTVSCIVRCSFTVTAPSDYSLNYTDVTIKVGEKLNLKLRDKNGTAVEATWSVDLPGYITLDNGKVTGVKTTTGGKPYYVTVTATYGEETFTCKVRVKAAS